MRSTTLLFSLAILLTTASCGGEKADDVADSKKGVDIDTSRIKDGVGEEMYDRAKAMFYSMPTPLELQSMIENSGGHFREDLLADPQKSSDYQTTEQEAFALGVYGADMSYSTVFDQQQDALLYMAAAQRVAKKMGIKDPFGPGLMERASNNQTQKDSMLIIVSEIYWELNSQLQEENRNQIGLIVLASSWVEGLYLGSQILLEGSSNTQMEQVIADQRFIASQLDALFKDYGEDPFIKTTEPFFRPLVDRYLRLPISETPTEVTKVNGKTVIGGAAQVKFTKEDLLDITRIVGETRAKIIAL
ncbi:MAG: hypothetical protein RLP15_04845 [Cryomorphaceae bacterium]